MRQIVLGTERYWVMPVSQVRVRMQPADSEAPRPGGSCITVFAFVTFVFSDMTRFRQRPHKVLILEYRGPEIKRTSIQDFSLAFFPPSREGLGACAFGQYQGSESQYLRMPVAQAASSGLGDARRGRCQRAESPARRRAPRPRGHPGDSAPPRTPPAGRYLPVSVGKVRVE